MIDTPAATIDDGSATAEAMPAPPTAVRVAGLHKTFGRGRAAAHVLKHVDLDVAQGELLVLLGPSGCGKTTLLRCLVGLERPSDGTIELGGELVVDADRGVLTAPNRRNVGMVFQNYALWPHMTVTQNVAYPLRARKRREALSSGRVQDVLETVQCAHLAGRYPRQLSGGQQQRVSLARALAPEPALLLLDEPLSNLDALLRIELRAQLRVLHRSLGFTAVYVTDDQDEALALGSRVAVMNEGQIEQIGDPREVHGNPASERIAEFLGARNRFALTMGDDGARVAGQPVPELGSWAAGRYSLRIRPSHLRLRAPGDTTTEPSIAWLPGGEVLEVLPGIDRHEHVVAFEGERYFADLPTAGPLVLVTAGLLAVASLVACGSDERPAASSGDASFDGVIERANSEGRLVVYTSTPEAQENRMVEAFTEKYPDIDVTVVRGAGELPERLAAEKRSNAEGADVFTFSDPSWFSKNPADLLDLDSPSVDSWPADYWEVERKAALSSIAPFGMIVWNTTKFPQGFRTWEDLLDPSVKGQLGTRSDMTAAYAGFLDFTERHLGADYLERLGDQDPKFYPSAVPMVQAVASGEIGVTNLSVPAIVKDLQEKGAPIQAVVPTPGYVGALTNAKNPNAARVYVDFVLSPEGQAAYNSDGYGASPLGGIEGATPLEGMELFESEKFTPEVLADWQRKTDAYFG